MLLELTNAAKVSWVQHLGAYDYSTRVRDEGSWSRRTPLIRLKTTLEPEAPGSRRGHIVFDIWVQAEAASYGAAAGPRHCEPLFSPGHDESYCQSPGQLSETLRTLMEASGVGYLADMRKEREVKFKNARDPTVTTIPGLLAAIESQERPQAAQPTGLNCQMRPYQLQALGFMQEAEQRTSGPFWFRAKIPPAPAPAACAAGAAAADPAAPPADEIWFCPMLARLTLAPPPRLRGGFLCEEMGLGKTVISLGVILSSPQPAAEKKAKAAAYTAARAAAGSSTSARKKLLIPSSATLVVCMVSIVGQWIEEAKSKLAADSELKIHCYHNTGREKDPEKLAKYDLVVTTYQTLGASQRQPVIVRRD